MTNVRCEGPICKPFAPLANEIRQGKMPVIYTLYLHRGINIAKEGWEAEKVNGRINYFCPRCVKARKEKEL